VTTPVQNDHKDMFQSDHYTNTRSKCKKKQSNTKNLIITVSQTPFTRRQCHQNVCTWNTSISVLVLWW